MRIKILFVSLFVTVLVSGPSFAVDRYKYSEIWQQPYETMDEEGVSSLNEQASDSQSDDSSIERKPSAVEDGKHASPVPMGVRKLQFGTEGWKTYHGEIR